PRDAMCQKPSSFSRPCIPYQAATKRTGRSVNRFACIRRVRYATTNMTTQHMALIEKQAANPQSDRLPGAEATVERCASRNSIQVMNDTEDAPFLSVAALWICGR